MLVPRMLPQWNIWSTFSLTPLLYSKCLENFAKFHIVVNIDVNTASPKLFVPRSTPAIRRWDILFLIMLDHAKNQAPDSHTEGDIWHAMMTSSNGNIFRVTGPLCGEFTGPGEFPTQRPVTRSFDVFFDLRLNKCLSKQPRGWWFETPLLSLWRHRNGNMPPVFWSLRPSASTAMILYLNMISSELSLL